MEIKRPPTMKVCFIFANFLPHWFLKYSLMRLNGIILSCLVKLRQHIGIKILRTKKQYVAYEYTLQTANGEHIVGCNDNAQIVYNGLFKNWWGHRLNPHVISPFVQSDLENRRNCSFTAGSLYRSLYSITTDRMITK